MTLQVSPEMAPDGLETVVVARIQTLYLPVFQESAHPTCASALLRLRTGKLASAKVALQVPEVVPQELGLYRGSLDHSMDHPVRDHKVRARGSLCLIGAAEQPVRDRSVLGLLHRGTIPCRCR